MNLYVNQYGAQFFARTRKELCQQIPGKCHIMYVDKKDGSTVAIGYVIGCHWLTRYKREEKPA